MQSCFRIQSWLQNHRSQKKMWWLMLNHEERNTNNSRFFNRKKFNFKFFYEHLICFTNHILELFNHQNGDRLITIKIVFQMFGTSAYLMLSLHTAHPTRERWGMCWETPDNMRTNSIHIFSNKTQYTYSLQDQNPLSSLARRHIQLSSRQFHE